MSIRTSMFSITAIGLISGTSMDGVDAALLTIEGFGLDTQAALKGAFTLPYPPELKKRLLLSCRPGSGSAEEICSLNFIVGEYFAKAALEVTRRCSREMKDIDLIGSHGQTIYHSPSGPGSPDGPGACPAGGGMNSTLQIGEAAVIARRTGVTTVADFRPADMAEGGTGAPLSPYVNFLLFKHLLRSVAIQNIGGISNVTVIPANGGFSSLLAFDTGPGNMVVDALAEELTAGELSCDRDGVLSSGGRVNEALLRALLTHPYFETPPPKASGREMFGGDYVRGLLEKRGELGMTDRDLIATAVALTAHSIARSYRRFVLPHHAVEEVLLCGGGARNPTLTAMLKDLLDPLRIGTTDDYGLPSDYLEAMTFAILANETLHGIAANLPQVTGAKRRVVLGKIVPGDNFHALMQSCHSASQGN